MEEPVAILLVDDQPRNLDVLEAILASDDYRLVRALSAEDALMALLDEDFAAIVLDIKMPGMSGLELARMIKQRKRTENVPLLFLTAHLLEESDMLRGYGVGAVDYLCKPINPDILRTKIAGFARLFRATRALAVANQALSAEVGKRQQAQEELRLANDELESRVRERTAELLRANEALRHSQAQAEALAREAEAANRAKDHFLAVLSHELRTPLTPVLLLVQSLERDASLPAAVHSALATIRRNVALESLLIDDLLDLTRVARGRLQLNLQTVDLWPILQQAVDTAAPEAAAKGVQLSLTCSAATTVVRGDPARLQQIFWNLIGNAIKFTPRRGEVRVACTTRRAREGSCIEVTVSDTGVGIDREFLPSVFDAFARGHDVARQHSGGLGLGLAICKALVELHGGAILADSLGEGMGAIFSVSLPTAAAVEVAALPPAKAAPVEPSSLDILLVEDHLDSARALASLLRTAGHNVTHASSVAAALAAWDQAAFDLVISDLGLPDGSGHELMRQIVALRSVPGIALSGYGMDADLAASHNSGFIEHLTKPVELSQLLDAIQRACSTAATTDGLG